MLGVSSGKERGPNSWTRYIHASIDKFTEYERERDDDDDVDVDDNDNEDDADVNEGIPKFSNLTAKF